MKVRIFVKFASPSESDWADMKSLGQSVTNDVKSVRVSATEARPKWLVVEFAMPTEPQYKAVDRIDRELRVYGGNRLDSAIGFPKSEAARMRAQRKSERRRAKRQATNQGREINLHKN